MGSSPDGAMVVGGNDGGFAWDEKKARPKDLKYFAKFDYTNTNMVLAALVDALSRGKMLVSNATAAAIKRGSASASSRRITIAASENRTDSAIAKIVASNNKGQHSSFGSYATPTGAKQNEALKKEREALMKLLKPALDDPMADD